MTQTIDLEALLTVAANAANRGQVATATRFYNEALTKAERIYGPDNPAVGMILLEMLDLYDRSADLLASEQIFERVRKIIVNHANVRELMNRADKAIQANRLYSLTDYSPNQDESSAW